MGSYVSYLFPWTRARAGDDVAVGSPAWLFARAIVSTLNGKEITFSLISDCPRYIGAFSQLAVTTHYSLSVRRENKERETR